MTIETIYTNYKPYFLELLVSRGFSEGESVQIYQDTIVSAFHHIDKTNVWELNSDIKNEISNHLEASVVKFKKPTIHLAETQKQLLKGFKNLSKSQQEILKKYYYKDLSVTEIASTTHKKIETVSETKTRAVKRLQHLIKTNGA